MKKLITTLLFATCTLSLAGPATDGVEGSKAAVANQHRLGKSVLVPAPTGNPVIDLANLNTAEALALAEGLTLVIDGAYTINDPWVLEGQNLTIHWMAGASIIQSDPTKNGIEISTVTPTHYLTLIDPHIYGPGYATSTGTGFYGRRGDDSYLCGDITIIGGGITGFQNGINLRNVVKVDIDRLDVMNCVTGIKIDKWDTFGLRNLRIVGSTAAGPIPNSRCFHFNDQVFGGIISGREFGGANIYRFSEITGDGVQAVFVTCNLEGFLSPQVNIMESTSENVFDFRYGRCVPRAGYTSSDSFLSINAGGNDQPRVGIVALSNWSPTSTRLVEVINSTVDPRIIGEPIIVRHTSSRGGAQTRAGYVYPGIQGWNVAQPSLPNSAIQNGQLFAWDYSGTGGDEWLRRAPVIKLQSNRSGSSARYSIVNAQHEEVVGISNAGSAASGTAVIHTVNLGQRMLTTNGERLMIDISGKTAANANNKRWLVKLNGNTLFDSGDLAINGKEWVLTFVCQADSGFERWRAELETDDAVIKDVMKSGDTNPVYGNTGGVALTFTVETVTTAAGDVTYACGESLRRGGKPALNN